MGTAALERHLFLMAIFLILSFGFFTPALAASQVTVFVSIPPQKSIVRHIGGDRVTVQVMVPPGANPATYEPKPAQMAALMNTRLYLAIGVPFENTWLDKIAAANPEMQVVHTDQDIEKRSMAAHHHAHGKQPHTPARPAHHHTATNDTGPESLDPHIWLAPPLVLVQAKIILSALQEADPTHRNTYADNFQIFARKVETLHRELAALFARQQGMRFIVFHPSWGYFAETYGLVQVPIEIEGKEPKPAHLQSLIQTAREEGISVIFAQPQFSSRSAQLLAREIGGTVLFADPLAEDWMTNLRHVARSIRDTLDKQTKIKP